MLAMPGFDRALGVIVMSTHLDPFGAPEFLVDDVAFRTMVGTDYIRFGYYTQEQDEKILRVKIVFPVRHLISSQDATRMYVMLHHGCLHTRTDQVLN